MEKKRCEMCGIVIPEAQMKEHRGTRGPRKYCGRPCSVDAAKRACLNRKFEKVRREFDR